MGWRKGIRLLALWLAASVACNLPLRTDRPTSMDPTLTALFAQVPTWVAATQSATPQAAPGAPPTPGPTPTPLPPPQPLRDRPLVIASRLTSAPTLDAVFHDWPPLPPYRAERVVYGAEQWRGPQDLSADFLVGWDPQALYLALWVTDDVYAQNAAGYQLYQGDEIEIAFDGDLFGDFEQDDLNADDVLLGISPGFGEPGQRTEAYLWFPEGQRGPRSTSVGIAARRTDNGYVAEIRVPWETLGVTPQAGGYYGFALRISDNDAPDQAVQQSMVANVPQPHLYNRPLTWGNLYLQP